MQQSKQYTCFVSENYVPVIVIPYENGARTSSGRLLYAGGEHALFYREGHETLILDYLDEDFRVFLAQASKALIFEVNLKSQDIILDYDVPIMHVPQLPSFEMETVEDYLSQS